jgi:hypothetical protein
LALAEHGETFAGLPIVRFDGSGSDGQRLDGPVAWEITTDVEDPDEDLRYGSYSGFAAVFEEFLDTVSPASVEALVVGRWGLSYRYFPPVELLCAAAGRLTRLKALFLGRSYVIYQQNHADVGRLLAAYPRLETLRLRGAPDSGDWRRPLKHASLRHLALETAGLPREVAKSIGGSDLPALEHLELWLGVREYGGTTTTDDLAPILSGSRWPRLRYLGLCNAEHADEVAAAVAAAPVVARLTTLDLSLGTFSDTGAEALLTGQPLTHLHTLDLHHHFVSEAIQARLTGELPGTVDLSNKQDDTSVGYRYTYVWWVHLIYRPTT